MPKLFSLFPAGVICTICTSAFGFPAKVTEFQNDKDIHKIAIIGKDTRSYDLTGYASVSKGIGVIFSLTPKAKWTCSSFCVADNVIATNAHCLYQHEKTNLAFVQFGFPVTYNYKAYLEQTTSVNYAVPDNIKISILSGQYRSRNSIIAQKDDWALAQLSQPICKKRTLQLSNVSTKALIQAGRRKKIFMIGFHQDDKMSRKQLSENCLIYSSRNRRFFPPNIRRRLRSNSTLIGHSCDGLLGSSGSPIFMKTAQGFRVVAINSGEFRFSKYQIKRDPYTGRTFGPRRLVYSRSINVGVHSKSFINRIKWFSNAKLLQGIEQFKELQSLLKQLNYYRGPVDGLHGRGTRKAIVQYEKKKSLPSVGFPTQHILKLLKTDVASRETLTSAD